MPCAIIGCHPEEQQPFSGQPVHVGRDSRTPGVEFPFSSFSKLDAWSGFVQPSITASFLDHHFAAFLGPVPAGISNGYATRFAFLLNLPVSDSRKLPAHTIPNTLVLCCH